MTEASRTRIAQIKARDEGVGRWISIRDGVISSGRGMHAQPDVTLSFKNAAIGASLLTPPINWLNQVNAQKDFTLAIDGSEDLTNWFAQTLMMMQTVGWKFGVRLPDGTMRYCNMANGGPLFVYVKDGKIIGTTPIDFDETDSQPWTIHARGMNLTPPRKTTLARHGQNSRSIIYSPDRRRVHELQSVHCGAIPNALSVAPFRQKQTVWSIASRVQACGF
jgi:trimethylamine-N-oxide reductase (cytochrome c)